MQLFAREEPVPPIGAGLGRGALRAYLDEKAGVAVFSEGFAPSPPISDPIW